MRTAVIGLIAVLTAPLIAQQQPGQPRPPIFRGGAHYVRVDAYPTDKNGRIVEGLTRDDFEIYEDGKPQSVETLDFVTFERWTPDGERRDPRTQQDAYDLAADPNWRVFVIVIDPAAYGMEGQHYLRGPLHEFIDRNLGPRDLFGLLSTENEWTDLTLGQTTTAANAVLDSREWLYRDDMFDEKWQLYYECNLGSMIPRKKLDDTYALFEGLVKLLGLIRQEKKSIVFVSNGLSAPGMMDTGLGGSGVPGIPGIPSAPPGPPGPGPRIRPPTGGGGGPVGPMGHGDRVSLPSRLANCEGERMRLAGIDFAQRYRDLLRDARAANVAFYPVSPAGLQAIPFKKTGGADLDAFRNSMRRADSLLSLASETDGRAIVNTNDLAGGLRRIADELRAYYVLGYYTNNTKWDGKVRTLKVRLKPAVAKRMSGERSVRARKQYRAPTEAEIARLSGVPAADEVARKPPPPPDLQSALAALDRQARAADEPALALLLPPQLFRARGAHPPEPAGDASFAREESIRVEWQSRRPLDRRVARVLDRTGKPLPIDVPLREGGVPDTLIVDLPVAAFARGDYVIELAAASGSISERSLLAFRVR